MTAEVRAFDWSKTPLGPIGTWAPALKTAVGFALSSGFPKAVVCGPKLVTIYNDGFIPILGGKQGCLGMSFRDIWREVWDEIGPIQERAYAGEPTFIEDFPLIVHRNGYPEQAYFTFSYGPIRDEHGRVLGMIDTVIETTAKVMADRNLRLINGELEHRIKNTLAMVCGIARQTFRRAISIEAAQETLLLRLEALGAAHSPLIQSKWTNAPIRAVIEGALAPYQSHAAQIALSGPPVELSARCSLSLGLAINELAANALKYGALSTEQGRITVRWTAGNPASDDPFNLVWEEQGGPPVAPATQSGFGQQLIHAVAADFGGEANTDLRETGAYFTLSTTMKQIDEHGAA